MKRGIIHPIQAVRRFLRFPHDWLCVRSKWYSIYHQHPRRHIHHKHIAIGSGLVGLAAIIVSAVKYAILVSLLASVSLRPTAVFAATQTWTSQSDWNNWTLASTTATDNPGSVQLSASGISGSWATETVSTPSWMHVGGSPDGDVWLANETGAAKAAHYISGSWTEYSIPGVSNALAITGVSSTDAWAVGVGGMIAHWNGSGWSSVASPASTDLKAVTAISASNVYAVGGSEVVIHYNGSSWSLVSDAAFSGIQFDAVSVNGASAVYIGGLDGSSNPAVVYYNGSTWANLPSPQSYNGNVFDLFTTASYTYATGFVTGAPFTARWNGSSWTDLAVPAADPSLSATQMAGSSDSDIWVVEAYAGDPTYYHWNGSSWAETIRSGVAPVPADIWGNASYYWIATASNTVDKFTATGTTYVSSGTANITYTPSPGQTNDWTAATPTTTTPTNTSVTMTYSSDGVTYVGAIASVANSESLYIRAALATTDTSVTSSLDALSIDYTALTAPTAASGVSIGSIATTGFTVSWTDNSSNETGFKVYTAAGAADCSTASYSGTPDYTTAADAVSQAITGKSVNSQYCAKVTATNAYGDSSAAYASPKYTLANTPGAPTVNTPTTTSLKAIINQNSNPAATEYAIYNDTTSTYVQADGTLGASTIWQNYATWGGASGIVNTGLSSGVSYTYKVKARNGDNTATALSSGTAVSTTATSPPTAASGVSIGTIDSTLFTVSWADNSGDETGFKVYTAAGSADCSAATYSGTPDFTTAASATSQAITGKSINTQYCAKVVATNADGDSSAAYAAPKYTLANTPSFTTVAGNYSDALSYYLDSTINTNSNPAGTNYYIQYSTDDVTYTDPSGMTWQTGTAYQLISLSANQQYWLKVKAKNGDGITTSYSSSSADVTPPAAPTSLTASNICSSTALTSWAAATGANTYTLSYGTDTAASNIAETASITATEKTLSLLNDQTLYYWKVKSTSTANGTGPYSAAVSFTSSSCAISPTAPADFAGAATSSSAINWRWSDSASAETGWKVENTAGTSLSGNLAANSTAWSEPNLSVNTAYTRHVNVFNADGSNDSNQATVYTLANVPSAPTLTVVSSSRIQITINKNGNPDANTRYAIAVSADNGASWNYVKHSDHTIQGNADWQLYNDWGGANGFTEYDLTPNNSYIYKVKAENGNYIATAFSTESSKATSADSPITGATRILTVSLNVGSTNGLSIKEGNTFQLVATVTDPDGNAVTDATLNWSVKNVQVGRVTQTGLYTAGVTGDYMSGLTVTATKGSLRGEARMNIFVSISDPFVTYIGMKNGSATLAPGTQYRFAVYSTDQNNVPVDLDKLGWTTVWSVEKPAAGTIDQTGLFTAKNVGDYLKVVHARVQKGADVRDLYGRVIITTEPRIMVFASMGSYRIPADSFVRWSTNGYDQFGSVFGYNPTFSLSVPGAGTIDHNGMFFPKVESGCYDWVMGVSHTVKGQTATGKGRLSIIPARTDAELAKLRSQFAWGLSGYTAVIKPGQTESIQARLYNGLSEVWPHTNFRFEMLKPAAGNITPTGFFTASQTEGTYLFAIKVTAYDTITGADKSSYQMHIAVHSQDQVLTKYYTGNYGVLPNSAGYSSIWVYDQYNFSMVDPVYNMKRYAISDPAMVSGGGPVKSINQYSGFFETSDKEGLYKQAFGGVLTHMGDIANGINVTVANKGQINVSSKYSLWCATGAGGTIPPDGPGGGGGGGGNSGGGPGNGGGDPNDPEIITTSPLDFVEPGSSLAEEIAGSSDAGKSFFSRLAAKGARNASASAAIALLIAAAAALIAPIASVLTVMSVPEYLRALLASLLSLRSRKKYQQWGKVTEEGTGVPIPQTRIDLVRLEKNISGVDEGKIVQTTYSDLQGNYAFVAVPGRYTLHIQKDMYQVSQIPDSYQPSNIITVPDVEHGLIVPKISLTMNNQSIEKKVISLKRSDLIERILHYISFGFLIFGTIIVISGIISRPKNPADIALAIFYPFLWYFNLRSVKKSSPFGDVLDRANYIGVPLALIRVMDKDGKRMLKTAVSDKEGRFRALLSKGNYKILVAKTGYHQPEPIMIDAGEDLNIVRKKIEIEKIVSSSVAQF